MKSFPTENSLRDFLHDVASPEGEHGTASAAAVTAGIGASLLAKVALLPQTRSDSIEDRTELVTAARALNDLQEQLIETVETETVLKIYAARNMPQASNKQRTERQRALQLAIRASSDVPLEVIRLCVSALQHAETVAAHCTRAAFSDVHLGVTLLHAAFNGSRANLEAKLSSLIDPRYMTSVIDEVARLSAAATTTKRAVDSFLQLPPA